MIPISSSGSESVAALQIPFSIYLERRCRKRMLRRGGLLSLQLGASAAVSARTVLAQTVLARPLGGVGALRLAGTAARGGIGALWTAPMPYRKRFFHGSAWTMLQSIEVPPMGEAVQKGELVEWLKQEGDVVAEDEVVCVLELDKVTVDIKSPVPGTLKRHLAKVDDVVRTGQVIAEVEEGEGVSPSSKGRSEEKGAEAAFSKPGRAKDDGKKVAEWPELNLKPPRKPMIQFRHGIRETSKEPASEASAPKAKPSALFFSPGSTAEYVHLPPLYGRLPPLTEEEEMRLRLGGADP